MTKEQAKQILQNSNLLRSDDRFRYMLLSRMQMDCEAYLQIEFPQRHLWGKTPQRQIEIMRALWYYLPVAPEWLTIEQINGYAEQMGVA